MSQFFSPGENRPFTKYEFETVHNLNITKNDFLELHYIFKNAIRNLGSEYMNIPIKFLPAQPLLMNILYMTKKVCNLFCRFLTKISNFNNPTVTTEIKWQRELGCRYSLNVWSKTYSITAAIKDENRVKLLQFQNQRNSLNTNYRVNKFKLFISPFVHIVMNTQS